MKVLIIKLSSMGDVLHTLPAITDWAKHFPNATIDWVIEESFQEIPTWHPAIHRVIPIALRRWRKNPLRSFFSAEFRKFLSSLRQTRYDLIIDAQGLVKSGLVAYLAKGKRHGFNPRSARDSSSRIFYQKTHEVPRSLHAVLRTRRLFAQIGNYRFTDEAKYGIAPYFQSDTPPAPYCVFIANTTWETKLWPESYWIALGKLIHDTGILIKITSGNADELLRSTRIAQALRSAEALPPLRLLQLGKILVNARFVVSLDTGLGHLAAALAVPNIALFGPTDPTLSGPHGKNQHHLAAQFSCAPCLQKTCTHPDRNQLETPPCFKTIPPLVVWAKIQSFLSSKK